MVKPEFTLNKQQQLMLHYVKHDAKGDLNKAKEMAGYSKNTTLSKLMDSQEMTKALAQAAREILAEHSALAAYGLVDVMQNPKELGQKNKLAAANSVLKMAGIEAESSNDAPLQGAIVILPAKNVEIEDTE